MHTDGESQFGVKRSRNRPPTKLGFPLSHALAPAPALQSPLEKVEISTPAPASTEKLANVVRVI